jgi:hypothetical protein
MGTQWRISSRHWTTSRKASGSIPVGVTEILHCHNPSGRTMALESAQPLTEMSKGKAVPLQAWSGPEGSRKLRLTDYVTMAQNGGKIVSLTYRPLFIPRKYSWYLFLYEAESTPGPRILCQWKIPITPAGIEPATSRFVAQHRNRCATLPRSPVGLRYLHVLPRSYICTCLHACFFCYVLLFLKKARPKWNT